MKLDIGCGKNKIAGEGWTGVDVHAFPGVDVVVDLTARETDVKLNAASVPFKPWPWENDSIDEVHCSHFVEHLKAEERIHFVNELHRILKPKAQARIITPHWASERSYGDLTHQWPPVVGFWFFYLDEAWRAGNAPHNDQYKCHFPGTTWHFALRPDLVSRASEYQQYALMNYKEAATDMIATLTKP